MRFLPAFTASWRPARGASSEAVHTAAREDTAAAGLRHIFGRIIPRLNLAANWLRFPRAAPAPGMVAARRGHVFVLKRHISGNTWLVWDANSGRGKTRVHPRSIAGFTIVDPRAGA